MEQYKKIQIKQIHYPVDENLDGLWYVEAEYKNGKRRTIFRDRYRSVCVKYVKLMKEN